MYQLPPKVKNLKRLQTPFGRLYYDGVNLLPSVTTILGETEPDLVKYSLKKWSRSNKEYSDLAKSRGTNVHELLEFSINQSLETALAVASVGGDSKATAMFWGMYSFIENTIPIASELTFFLPELGYAGTIDYLCQCKLSGLIYVIDWKTSMKPKLAHTWYNHPMQLAAYMKAAEVLLNTNTNMHHSVDNGIIVRASFDTPTQTYFMNKEQSEQKFTIFKRRKQEYLVQVKNWLKNNVVTLEDVTEE